MQGRSIEKAIFLTNVSSYVMKGTGILASLFVLRVLSPGEFGAWKVALAIASVASAWFMAIHPAVTAEMIRSEVDTEKERHGFTLWRGYWRLTLILGVLLMVASVVLGKTVSRWFGLEDARLFYLAVVLIFLWVLKLHAQIWSKVLYQFRPILWAQMIEGVSYILGLLVLTYYYRLGAFGLGIANIISVIFGLMCSGALIVKGWYRCPPTSFWQDIRELAQLIRQHGKWAFIVKLLKDNIDSFRIWFIQWMIGPHGVGLYSFAQSLLGQFLTLINIESVFVATAARYVEARDRFLRVLCQASRLSVLVYGGIFLLACASVPFIVPYAFPAYVPGIPVFLTLAPFILLNGVYVILANVFYILRWQKRLSVIYIGRVVIFGLMILIVGWKRPLVTASLEFVVGTGLQVVAMIYFLSKEFKRPALAKELFVPTREDFLELKLRATRLLKIIFQRIHLSS